MCSCVCLEAALHPRCLLAAAPYGPRERRAEATSWGWRLSLGFKTCAQHRLVTLFPLPWAPQVHSGKDGPGRSLCPISDFSPLQTGLVRAELAIPGCVCWHSIGERGHMSTSPGSLQGDQPRPQIAPRPNLAQRKETQRGHLLTIGSCVRDGRVNPMCSQHSLF